MRRSRLAWILAIVTLVLVGGLYWSVDEWHFRSERIEIRRDVAQGRYARAQPRLIRLTERRPRDGELLYHLGLCESYLGREDEAVRAWSRVPEDSDFSGRAAVQRAKRELLQHRLSASEPLLVQGVKDRGEHSLEAFETLLNLFKIEGRFEEALDLAWGFAECYPDQIALLREIAQLGSVKPHRLDLIREGLEIASRAQPDDDRVWLGWANLATRVGRFEEAARRLRGAEQRRPDDPAIWRAWLSLAVATSDVERAWLALGHLSTDIIKPVEVLTLRAWFASKNSDEPTERQSLIELLNLAPTSFAALDRLAEIELRAGRIDESLKLRTRKAELDRAKDEYDRLLSLKDASNHAVELARLAMTLHRLREARLLWKFIETTHPGDTDAINALASLDRDSSPAPPPGCSLASLMTQRPGRRPSREARSSAKPSISQPVFTDDATSSQLQFIFENGSNPLCPLPQTMSGGVGLLDYDGDGWLDVYCVQGGSPPNASRPTTGDRLFRNQRDGTFIDVSTSSRIDSMPRGYGHGVAVGDYDNDGHPDLFITRMDSYALYRNKGDGTFEDCTEFAGLGGYRDWPTSAAFADLDGDGDLDLYVCHYLEWDSRNPRACYNPATKKPMLCEPLKFKAMPDHLFRNDGGRFVDVTTEAGIVDPRGQGLGVVACDFDKDGLIDLFVANDQSANLLFRNRGNLRFEEVGLLSGVGSSADGSFQANMGIACGDQNGDGLPDLVVTEFYNEGATLYQNLGRGLFGDHSAAVGLKAATRSFLGFGVVLFDYDANGTLDLAIANGHVEDLRPKVPYMMLCQLLGGTSDGRFVDVSSRAGPVWQVPRIGRGLASGDLDNDGRVDLVVLSQNQPLAYLHNKTPGGHWLTLRLEGATSCRDAIGARVVVTAGGRRQTSWRIGGGSYQSASDSRLHFGIGDTVVVEQVEVTWPTGKVERFERLTADAGYLIREGELRPMPLVGFGR